MLFGCGDVNHEYFATYEEAKSAEMFEKGWLPYWVPGHAEDIYVSYDLDTSIRAFSYTDNGPKRWPHMCSYVGDVEQPQLKPKSFPKHFDRIYFQLRRCNEFWGAATLGEFYYWYNEPSE